MGGVARLMVWHACDECGVLIEGADMEAFGDAYIGHARAAHADWPYPDTAIRNYAEATQRLTGSTERLAEIGTVTVEQVTEDRIDDWLSFFDHDAMAGMPPFAACYCLEPHVQDPREVRPPASWRENREQMVGLLRSGQSFGYLAYVDGRPAGWVNASVRSDYALFRRGEDSSPPDGDVIGVSCFVIAPPYRRHGLATHLLAHVITDAPRRGLAWIEAYPFNEASTIDASNFRGPRPLYEVHGFEAVKQRARDTVMRRPVAQQGG